MELPSQRRVVRNVCQNCEMIHLSVIAERRLRTSVVYLGVFALGICTSIPGPTLLELEKLVNAETSNLTTIYLSRSTGYLIGSFTGGITLDKGKHTHVQIFLFTLIMALATIAIPFCRKLLVLISVMAVSGIAMGALDTGVNVWCLNVWEDENSPYFQALHFFFGVGASLAPSIAGIFLPHKSIQSNETAFVKNYSESLYNSSQIDGIPPVTYAYISVGVNSLIVALLFACLFLIKITDKKLEEKLYKDPSTCPRFTVLVVTFLLLAVYCGTEIGFGQMIATYAVKSNHKFSQSSASYITSLFWGTFTIFRGFAIYFALKFRPRTILIVDFIVMSIASAMLAVLGDTYITCLWFGTGLLGIGLASFYASTITWVQTYVNVSNMVGSSFVVSGSLGEMIAPLTISQYVKETPQFLMYITLGCVNVCGILILIMWIVTSHLKVKTPLPCPSHLHKKKNPSTETMEEIPLNTGNESSL